MDMAGSFGVFRFAIDRAQLITLVVEERVWKYQYCANPLLH
jgi:hypothetical protein